MKGSAGIGDIGDGILVLEQRIAVRVVASSVRILALAWAMSGKLQNCTPEECAKFDCCFEPDGVELCDTLALSRYLRPELESHALDNLLEPLGAEGVNSHDALDDVMACASVFFKLLS